MRRAILVRTHYTADGAFGRMEEWVMAEEEWLGNRPGVSCIPTGLYVCERTIYKPGVYDYVTWEVTGVPGRTDIKIHPFNTEEGTEGCIGLGLQLGRLEVADEDTGVRQHKIAVLSSRIACSQFLQRYPPADGRMELEIVDFVPPMHEVE